MAIQCRPLPFSFHTLTLMMIIAITLMMMMMIEMVMLLLNKERLADISSLAWEYCFDWGLCTLAVFEDLFTVTKSAKIVLMNTA